MIDEAFLYRSGEVGGDGGRLPGGAADPDAIEDIVDDVFYSVGGEGAVVALQILSQVCSILFI